MTSCKTYLQTSPCRPSSSPVQDPKPASKRMRSRVVTRAGVCARAAFQNMNAPVSCRMLTMPAQPLLMPTCVETQLSNCTAHAAAAARHARVSLCGVTCPMWMCNTLRCSSWRSSCPPSCCALHCAAWQATAGRTQPLQSGSERCACLPPHCARAHAIHCST